MAALSSFAANERVNRLRFEATTSGVAETSAALDALATANAKVATTSEVMERAQTKAATAATTTVAVADRQSTTTLRAGQSLDRLIKSIDDQYRAETRIAAGKAILDNSMRQGLITEAEHATRLDQIIARYSLIPPHVDPAGKAIGLTAYEMKNLGFQVNDAVTMLASGSSAFQVMATQGGQVYQVLAGANGGVTGAVSSLAGSAYGMLGPIGLAAAGFTAVTGGILYFATSTKDSTKIIEDHTAALKGMKEAQDLASSGRTDYTQRGVEGYKTELLADRHDLERSLRSLTSSALWMVQGNRTADIQSGNWTFVDAYEKFEKSVAAGHPVFVAFHDDLEAIAAANRDDLWLQKQVKSMEDVTRKGYDAEIQLRKDADAFRGITETTRDATGHLAAFTAAMSKLQSGVPEYLGHGLSARVKMLDDYRKIEAEAAEARKSRETMGPDMIDVTVDLRRRAALDESASARWKDLLEGRLKGGMPKYAVENLDSSLGEKLAAAFEAAAARGASLPTINEGYRTYADQAALYARLGPKIAARPGTSLHERGAAVDLGLGDLSSTSESILREEMARRGIVNTNWEKHHFAMGSDVLAEKNKASQAVFEQGESWRKTITDFEKGTQAIVDQSEATRKNSSELVKEKAALELTTALKRDNVPITADLSAQIDREATARMRAVQAQERWQKSIQAADEVRSTSKSMLAGFIGDLERGVGAMQAFQHVVEKLRDRLTEKLSDTIIDQLLGRAGSTLGGGGGLLSSLASGIGHYLGLYAEGGTISGGGWGIVGERGPEIVQGPAHVTPFAKVPVAAVSAAPTKNVLEMTVNLAGANGDQAIRAFVLSVLHDGISRFSSDALPGRIAEIQMRGM